MSKYQVIVPMSGFGERFRRAGYCIPKPLIEIEGRPIIGHVVDMFPGETDFIFICNKDHLAESIYRMEEILRGICPTGRIIGIDPHRHGPVHAVRQVEHLIADDRPVIVNYCDFTCYWDWNNFKKFVEDCRCVGALPAYKGFHPHSLGSTNYAYIREDGLKAWDIQEKQPFTENRMNEYASSGTYYFASGAVMKRAFGDMIEQDLSLNGEYYVSLAYKPLMQAQEPIAVYPLQHFMQWGTPEDVAEYNRWSETFRALLEPRESPEPPPRGVLVVPMAGLGARFSRAGYERPKPLIPVFGRPMVEQAVADMPSATAHAFVLRSDLAGVDDVARLLTSRFARSSTVMLADVTQGQACSALAGFGALETFVGPLTFCACDNGVLYRLDQFDALWEDDRVDVLVWGVRGHPDAVRRPEMFGWIAVDADGAIESISVKTPLGSPATDPIVIGTFSFRRPEDFLRCVGRLLGRDGRINGEYYLDSCINDALGLGLRCRLFEVDHYLSWGTPNDLETFEYWQSCFHKWAGHPYRLDHDARIDPDAVPALEARYAPIVPLAPASESKR